MATPAVYATTNAPSASIIAAPESTTSLKSSTLTTTKRTSSTSHLDSSTVSASLSHTTTVTTSVFPSATSAFTFLQIDGDNLISYQADQVDSAAFTTICPGGNCYDSCSNFSLLLDKDSYVFNSTTSSNITSATDGITLFSVCSNIGNVTEAVNLGDFDTAESFFPTNNAEPLVESITLNTTLCLSDTCQATRDPKQCKQQCDPATLMTSETSMDIEQVRQCLFKLCSNTCGLPDANQDVFGIGVLISYIVQAILVIVAAAGILVWTAVQLFKSPANQSELPESWQDGLSTFLAAECYFGVSSVIASFSMKPLQIDPLNGYALLSVAITGFMPPVFTLMLLHNQGKKSWFSTTIVFISWLLSSILFFMLLQNLRYVANNPTRLAEARNSLFEVGTCGGYSAMSLCQENIHNDPLQYLTLFYNKQSVPSIRTVIVLWLWTTVVLGVLQFRQVFSKEQNTNSPHPSNTSKGLTGWRGLLASTRALFHNRGVRFGLLLLTSLLFGLAFGYQAQMVIQYFQMDVVDKNGWTFGQWVAVLFWIPPLIDFLRGLLEHHHASAQNSATAGTTKGLGIKRQPLSSASYQPLAHSPLPSSDPFQATSPYEPLRSPSQPQAPADNFELRRINRQTTSAMEAGR